MRASRLFWGIVVLTIGVVLLLMNLGLVPGNIWWVLWPMLLIAMGVWFLLGPMFRGKQEVRQISMPLGGYLEADIKLEHGAGRLTIQGQSLPDQLLQGTFAGGVVDELRPDGAGARVLLKVPTDAIVGFPWFGMQPFNWDIALNPSIPLRLRLATGAGESQIDLSNLQVRDLRLESGASSTHLTLPASGITNAEIKTGAAALNLRVPASTAARIQIKSGLSGITVDTHRFHQVGDVYQSPDYATAQNRADVLIETGVGSVDIR